MGAWGTAIFSDDTALDVRDEWCDAVLDGLSPEDATRRLVESFDDHLGKDEETEKLFWIALAAAQFETGRLLPEVRERALAIIEAGGDVDRWREDGDEVAARQRLRVLERLAQKLRGPQPAPKRLRRARAFSVPFDVGDVVRLRGAGGLDELVLVVGHLEARVERHPVVAAIDWDGGAIPNEDALSKLRIVRDQYSGGPLLIDVFTLSKEQVFDATVGEVVAKGVAPSEQVDASRFGRSMHWRLVGSAVREARTRPGGTPDR